MGAENIDKIEVIDNEKIVDEKIQLIEDKVAINKLNEIDSQIKGYDIDLTVDRVSKTYKFISKKEGSEYDTQILNIDLKLKEITEYGEILVNLFNNKLVLSGDYHLRLIHEDTWVPNGVEDKYATTWDTNLSKLQVEELYVFAMNTQNIPMEEWNLDGPICKGAYDNECKEDLGIK